MIEIQVTGSQAVRANMARIGTVLTQQALAETAVKVEDYIEGEAGKHHQTGALVRSIYKAKAPNGWEIGHDLQHAPHALFVHWGTKPHTIRPKNKQTLRWPVGGKFIFAKEVHHPGTKPDKWLERAAALAPKIFEQQIAAKLKAL